MGTGGFESAAIGTLFNWSSTLWQIGPSVQLPIFEGGRNVANLRLARAEYNEGVARYRQQVLVAFQDVEDALVDLRTLSVQADAQDRAVAAARRTLELSNQQFKQGAVTFLDIVDAERTVLSDERTGGVAARPAHAGNRAAHQGARRRLGVNPFPLFPYGG